MLLSLNYGGGETRWNTFTRSRNIKHNIGKLATNSGNFVLEVSKFDANISWV